MGKSRNQPISLPTVLQLPISGSIPPFIHEKLVFLPPFAELLEHVGEHVLPGTAAHAQRLSSGDRPPAGSVKVRQCKADHIPITAVFIDCRDHVRRSVVGSGLAAWYDERESFFRASAPLNAHHMKRGLEFLEIHQEPPKKWKEGSCASARRIIRPDHAALRLSPIAGVYHNV